MVRLARSSKALYATLSRRSNELKFFAGIFETWLSGTHYGGKAKKAPTPPKRSGSAPRGMHAPSCFWSKLGLRGSLARPETEFDLDKQTFALLKVTGQRLKLFSDETSQKVLGLKKISSAAVMPSLFVFSTAIHHTV